jgi:uncharacterized protein
MLKTLVLVVSLLVGVRLYFYYFEKKTLYYPMQELELTPNAIGLPFENIALEASDGTALHAWYLPKDGAAHTVLFFHGNAGNISHRLATLALFNRMNLSTFIVDYRGYGTSEGQPSEKGFYKDAHAAYDYVHKHIEQDSNHIILFGESLGCAVAVDLATQRPAAAIVLESSFSSCADMGKAHFPYLPIRLILTQKFDAQSKIASVHVPKYFIHSRSDEIVPFALGKKLFEAAADPKEFLERPGGHNNYLLDPSVYAEVFRKIRQGHP